MRACSIRRTNTTKKRARGFHGLSILKNNSNNNRKEVLGDGETLDGIP